MDHDLALMHQRELIAICGRQIEIVEDAQDRQIGIPGKAKREIEHGQLMGEIEVGRGLVEEQDGGLLGEGARQQETLALTARHLTNPSVSKVRGIDERQRTSNDRVVQWRCPPKHPKMWCPPGQRNIPAGQRLGHQGMLWLDRHLPGNLGATQGAKVSPIKTNRPLLRTQQPGGQAQKRRFARTIRAKEPNKPTRPQRQRHIGHDRWRTVAEGDSIDLEPGPPAHQNAIRFCRRSRKRKNGAPTAAVMTPTGISLGPAAARAPVSAMIKNAAPKSAAVGTNRR